MAIRWRRVVLAVFVIELASLALLAVVTAFGPSDRTAAVAFAAGAARWVAPLGGIVAAFALGWWVSRPLGRLRLAHGAVVGLGAASLHAGLLLLGDAAFDWIHVAAVGGRIVAAMTGSVIRSPAAMSSPAPTGGAP